MRKYVAISIAIALTVLAAFVGFIVYELETWNDPVKELDVRDGGLGVFFIGERKEELLARVPSWSYSPQPKPLQCPANWIKPATMTEVQRTCLMQSDLWGVGHTNAGPCPPHSDEQASLQFQRGRVTAIGVKCTPAE